MVLQEVRDLLEKGNLSEAEAILRRTLELEPRAVDAWALLAYTFQQYGRYSAALDNADTALGLDGRCWLAALVRGLALKSLGRLDQAKDAFATAVEISPQDRQSWKLLLDATKRLDGLQAARWLVENAISQTPLPAEILDELQLEEARASRRWEETYPFLPIDNLPIRIDFLFQLPDVWGSLASVWEACVADPRIRARLVLLPFIHSDMERSERAKRFLDSSNLQYIEYCDLDWDQSPPHIVFIQNPFDSTRPAAFTMEDLARRGIRVAYVPYAIEIAVNPHDCLLQYDLPVQRQAWRIFSRSHQHRDLFAKYCATGNSHVVVTGHPKLDRIAALDEYIPDSELVDFISGRKSVLWTPHFTVDSDGLSTYTSYQATIFAKFASHPELVLIWRPHPLFFGRMRQLGLLTIEQERQLRKTISDSRNIVLDERPDYLHSFAVSDALMADCGSFLLEYLPTTRPILFLTKPNRPELNEIGIPERYHTAYSSADVESFIDYVRRGEDPWRETRMAQQTISLGSVDGGAGMRIKDHIVCSLLSSTPVA